MKLIAHRDDGFIETTCEECGRVVIVKADDDVPLTLCPPCGGGCVCAAYEPRPMEDLRSKKPGGRALTIEELTLALRNIGFDLTCGACAGQFYTGAGLGEHTCARKTKYGIMHPSDRALGLNYEDEEIWGCDHRPILFDTAAEAQSRIDERRAQYPTSDWRDARVVRYTPGVPAVYPAWEDVPK